MKTSMNRVEEFIKNYPIKATCSVDELNKLSQELQNEILKESISFSCEGKNTAIIYSGRLGDKAIFSLVDENIINGNIPDAYYISNTAGGKLLNRLKEPLIRKVGEQKATEILWGKGVGKDGERIAPYMNELGKQDGTLCLNSFCSQKYVEACKSDHLLLISCSGDALEQKALVTTELPNILNNEKITSINGIPTADLRRMRAEFEANGLSADESMVKVAEVLESSSANFVCMKDGENVLDYDKINEYISEGTVKQDLKPLEVAQNRETYDRAYGIEKTYENVSAKDMYQCGGDAYVAKSIANHANEYVEKCGGSLNEQQRGELTKELGNKINEYYKGIDETQKLAKTEQLLEHKDMQDVIARSGISQEEISQQVKGDSFGKEAEIGATEKSEGFSLEAFGQKIEESLSAASKAKGDLQVNKSQRDRNRSERADERTDTEDKTVVKNAKADKEKEQPHEKGEKEDKVKEEEKDSRSPLLKNDDKAKSRAQERGADRSDARAPLPKDENKAEVKPKESSLESGKSKDVAMNPREKKFDSLNKITDDKLKANMNRKAVVVKDDVSILKGNMVADKAVKEGQLTLDQSKALLNTSLQRGVSLDKNSNAISLDKNSNAMGKEKGINAAVLPKGIGAMNGNAELDIRVRDRNINKTDTLNASRKVVTSDNIKLKSHEQKDNTQRIKRNSLVITDKTNIVSKVGSKASASVSSLSSKAKGKIESELDNSDDMGAASISAMIKTGDVAKDVAKKTYSTTKSIVNRVYSFSKRNPMKSSALRSGQGYGGKTVGKAAEKKVIQTAQKQTVKTAQKQAVKTAQKQAVKTVQKVAVKTVETTAKVAAKTAETTATTAATAAAAPATMGISVAVSVAKEVANVGISIAKKTGEMITKMSGMDGGNKGILWAAALAVPIGLIVSVIAVPLLTVSSVLSFDFFGVDENAWLETYITNAREALVSAADEQRSELEDEGYDVRYRKMDEKTVVEYSEAAVRNDCPTVVELKQFVQPLFHAELIMITSDGGFWDQAKVLLSMKTIADDIWGELIRVEHLDLPTEYCGEPWIDGIRYANADCPNKSEKKYHNPPSPHASHPVHCCYRVCHGHTVYDCDDPEHITDDDHDADCPHHSEYHNEGCETECSGYVTCEGHPVAAVYIVMDKYIELLDAIILDNIEELEVKEADGTISEEEQKDLDDLRTQYEYAIMTMIIFAEENCPDQYVDTSGVQFTPMTSFACSHVGYPYKYGGNEPKRGIDCSGFTQYIFGEYGVELPRTAAEQANEGRKVYGLSSAQPGDLIFWSDDGTSASHVAIYLGNNKIVHASNSMPYPRGGIKVSYADYNNPIFAIRRFDFP